MDLLRIGIVGAGRIAGAFADSSSEMKRCRVVAIGSRSLPKAQEFARAHSLDFAFGSYQELVDSREIDCVYIAGPNGMHKEWSINAAQAGKHVLCEKPMALSEEDAREMFASAAANRVHLIEAFPFRFQPQTLDVLGLVRSGELGEILTVTAGFGFTMNNPGDVRLEPAQGGGAVWDVGSYCVNMIAAVMGGAPSSVESVVRNRGEVDFLTHAMLTYQDGRASSFWCSFESQFYRGVKIVGTRGLIDYGFPNHTGNAEEASFALWRGDQKTVYHSEHGSGFALEADALAALVAGEKFEGTTPEETIANTATLVKVLS